MSDGASFSTDPATDAPEEGSTPTMTQTPELVEELARDAARSCPSPYWQPYAVELSPGAQRLLDADRPRLFRLMAQGKHAVAVELLADMVSQVDDLDALIAAHRPRQQVRPTIAMALKGGRS